MIRYKNSQTKRESRHKIEINSRVSGCMQLYFFIPTDLLVLESVNPAEVIESTPHGELPDQGDFLRHVTYARSRNSGARSTWISSQNPYISRVEMLNSDDAG